MKPTCTLIARTSFLWLPIFMLGSCTLEERLELSLDSDWQKQGSSGGSSENSELKIFGSNMNVYEVNWITGSETFIKTRYRTDASANRFDPLGSPLMVAHRSGEHAIGLGYGLEFIQKGSKNKFGAIQSVSTLNYLELPVNAVYGFRLANQATITAAAGPYIAFGLGGHSKSTVNGQTTKAKLFTANGGYRRFDAGGNLGLDYLFPGGFSAGLGYGHGWVNIQSTNGAITKNRIISLHLGYSLGKLLKGLKK